MVCILNSIIHNSHSDKKFVFILLHCIIFHHFISVDFLFVTGIMATVGTFPGFAGVYMVGYILEATNQWSVIFIMTAFVSIAGWVGYVLYGSSEILF